MFFAQNLVRRTVHFSVLNNICQRRVGAYSSMHSYVTDRLQWMRFDYCHGGLFSAGRRVLILGDGNLSFSVAFANARPEVELSATVLEHESALISRYQSAARMLTHLRSLSHRVRVLFGVDARCLPLKWKNRFDDIIWNFPHPGGKTNLRKSRQLMSAVFKSISSILSSGHFHVTLARNQSGLDHEAIVRRHFFKSNSLPAHSRDSWQIAYLAAEWNLSVEDVHPFDPHLLPLYSASGYHNRDQIFHSCCGAETITFVLTPPLFSLKALKCYENELFADKEPGCFHELKPFFRHDISILYEEANAMSYWESVLFEMIREVCGSLVVAIEEVQQLRSIAPNGLSNRIYRITWQAWRKPLSKSLCNALQEQLREIIKSTVRQRKMKIVLT